MATQGYKMDNASASMNESEVLHTTRNGIKAFGVYDGEKFGVLEGSQVDTTSKCEWEKIESLRRTAIANGDVIEKDGVFSLKVSMEFNSPSGAAAFVLGHNANGWVSWKDKDGKTLDELFRQK